MAAVLIVRDPDVARRREAIRVAEAALRRFDLEVASAEHGPVAISWGAFAGAPVSRAPGAFVLGEVIPGPGPERLDAAGYAERVAAAGMPPAFDGFHFAITFDARGAFSVAVDLLGALPVYHASWGEVLLGASSPALIAA